MLSISLPSQAETDTNTTQSGCGGCRIRFMPRGVYERTPEIRKKLGQYERTPEWLERNSSRQRGRCTQTGEPARGFFYNKKGYKILTGQQGHPIATSNHQVPEHRKVLYDKIGPGVHQCTWCNRDLEWTRGRPGIWADHLDGNKTNNVPENLVPSCWLCNFRRGRAGNPTDWVTDVRSRN